MLKHKGKLVFSTIIALTLLSIASLIVCAASVKVIDVKSGDEYILALNLNNKDVVNGSITISSVGRNIYFWIADPQGTKIIDYGLATLDAFFQFTANSSGAYSLHFDNRFSSTRTVTVSYSIYPNASETDWFVPIGVTLVIIAVSLIALLLYFKTRKK